jgi:hypothetical protein
MTPRSPWHALHEICRGRRSPRPHHVPQGPSLGYRQRGGLFSPSASSGAPEKQAPRSSSPCGAATLERGALHRGPCPVRFALPHTTVQGPTASHCPTRPGATACSRGPCGCPTPPWGALRACACSPALRSARGAPPCHASPVCGRMPTRAGLWSLLRRFDETSERG